MTKYNILFLSLALFSSAGICANGKSEIGLCIGSERPTPIELIFTVLTKSPNSKKLETHYKINIPALSSQKMYKIPFETALNTTFSCLLELDGKTVKLPSVFLKKIFQTIKDNPHRRRSKLITYDDETLGVNFKKNGSVEATVVNFTNKIV